MDRSAKTYLESIQPHKHENLGPVLVQEQCSFPNGHFGNRCNPGDRNEVWKTLAPRLCEGHLAMLQIKLNTRW